jgi:hypothetical protein
VMDNLKCAFDDLDEEYDDLSGRQKAIVRHIATQMLSWVNEEGQNPPPDDSWDGRWP